MGIEVVYSQFRFSVRFHHILPIIDLPKLTFSLQSNGYSLTQPLLFPVLIQPFQTNANGVLAHKAGNLIDISTERNFIGLQNSSMGSLIEAFDELSNIISFSVPDISKNVWFYELQGNIRFVPGIEGQNVLLGIGGNTPNKITEFGLGLGEQLSPKSLKFGSANTDPSSPNYFDITIEPYLTNYNEVTAMFVYRHKKRGRVVDIAKKMIGEIEGLFDTLLDK